MTRIINTRSGAADLGVDPIPRAKLRGYLYAAARDSYLEYEACPRWRPLRRAYLQGLSEALYDAWATWNETERHELVGEVLHELGRNPRKES